MSTLATKIRSKKATKSSEPSHLIVEALAGTGKTTTLIEGLKRLKGLETSIEPSIQQLAIWEELEKSKDANSICFVAFNKSIATELQERVPVGCSAMTMHSMGNKAVTSNLGKVRLDKHRVQDTIADILQKDIRELRGSDFSLVLATEKLVGLCKMNLVGFFDNGYVHVEPDELDHLASYYDVELNNSAERVFDLVPQVLARCLDVKRDSRIDFNDMIWLPIALDLLITRYDLLLVDEVQDLNRCQQQLALRAGRRLVMVGDSYQSIYGFAGADSESMQRMKIELQTGDQGCKVLPLTVTRRCGKAIVEEAKKIVPQFEAHESNPPGYILYKTFKDTKPNTVEQDSTNYMSWVTSGDMILCRVTAPLVSQCFKFLKQKRRAEIIGRDIGQGLINLIKKMNCNSVVELVGKLSDWSHKEVAKERAKRFPNESRIIAIQDKHDCLVCFTEGVETVQEVLEKIESVFTDSRDSDAIRLSTIHKAKGLESDRVFFLMPEGGKCPHPMAKSAWQVEQERHLLYVGITRARKELVYVS